MKWVKVACVQYSFKVTVVNFNNINKLSASISCSAIKSMTSTNTYPRTLIKEPKCYASSQNG